MNGFGTPSVEASFIDGLLSQEATARMIQVAVDGASDGVIIHRPDGTLLYWNETAARDAGFEPEQILGLTPWGWTQASRDTIEECLRQLNRDGTCRFNTVTNHVDGTCTPIEVNARWIETAHGPIIISMSRDVSEKIATEESLREMAFRDKLTGLANRAMLEDRLKLAISSAQRHHDNLGLLYIDLDDFKPINDTYGHSVGDEVLKVVAQRMQSCLRTDDTVARVGGDEFVIVLPRLRNSSDIKRTAEKVHAVVSERIHIGELCICCLTASVGHALFDPDTDDAHSLLIRADVAMYHARQSGTAIAGAEPLE